MIAANQGYRKDVLPGICIAEIARGASVSSACVSRILDGKRAPRLATAVAICAYITDVRQRRFTIKDLQRLIDKGTLASKSEEAANGAVTAA